MMRPLEAVVFLSLAAGLHVGVWSVAPRMQGAAADGGPGQAPVTLAAAAAQQASLARSWQAAPETLQRTAQPAPAAAGPAPDRPRSRPDLHHLTPAPPALALAPVLPTTLPATQPAPPNPAPTLAVRSPDAPPEPPQSVPPADPAPTAPRSSAAPPKPQPPHPVAAAPDAPVRADVAPPDPTPAIRPKERPKERQRQAQARPAAAAAPASTASSGGKSARSQAGRDGADSTQSANAAARNAIQARWGAQIQRKVHRNLVYPRGASGAGNARVALTVDRNGQLTGLRLTRSSGVEAFDAAALNAVRRAGRFPDAPDELTQASFTFTLSLAFRP